MPSLLRNMVKVAKENKQQEVIDDLKARYDATNLHAEEKVTSLKRKREQDVVKLETLSLKELKALAKTLKVKGYTKFNLETQRQLVDLVADQQSKFLC